MSVTQDQQPISIDLDVPLVPQPTPVSCWAAALTMVVSIRDRASYAVEDVAARAGMDTTTGYGWDQIQTAVSAWNLHAEGPRSTVPGDWWQMLQSNGPLWVVEVGNPFHAVVVVGLNGDGTPGATEVKVNNPWPPTQGAVETKTFEEFENEFELGAGANAMVVHA